MIKKTTNNWHWHHKHPVEFSKNKHTPSTAKQSPSRIRGYSLILPTGLSARQTRPQHPSQIVAAGQDPELSLSRPCPFPADLKNFTRPPKGFANRGWATAVTAA